MTAKETARSKAVSDPIHFLSIGLLIGLGLVAFRQAWAVYDNVTAIQRYFDQRFLQGSETKDLLTRASLAGLNGDYEGVKSMLIPNLSKFTDPAEAADAYSYLGTAEYKEGHPQLAAGYFEKMYLNKPSSANLYTVAAAYDAGGNLDSALLDYSLFLSTLDSTGTPAMVSAAQQRVNEIQVLKGIKPSVPGTP